MTERVTLASQSAIRARLLRDAGVEIETASAGVDEAQRKAELLARGAAPAEVAGALAAAKALAVSARREGLVIGADQTLELDGELFDKPASLDVARWQLLALRGRMHRLHSAVTLARAGEAVWSHTATASLKVRTFSDAFLDGYLERAGGDVLSSVGAYQLEGLGAQLFERVDGDYFTVLGLPLIAILEALRSQGVLQR